MIRRRNQDYIRAQGEFQLPVYGRRSAIRRNEASLLMRKVIARFPITFQSPSNHLYE